MTIDTFKRHGNSFRSGVVACNGLMLNEEGKDEFDVTTETFADASKVGSFAIDFSGTMYTLRFRLLLPSQTGSQVMARINHVTRLMPTLPLRISPRQVS